MSEYQYYEFQAIDTPLDQEALEVMNNLSSRAHVTPTSFSNEYNYGNFKGNPLKLMELYYDAFVYVTNWGTRELMLKVPRKLINWDLIKQYSISEFATAYQKGENLIFEFTSETEDYEWEEGEGWLSSLISLRSDIMQGDYRCLYLGWLYGVQNEDFEDDEPEPPVPEGLKNLNGGLKSLIDFIRIDTDLVAVAAEKSKSVEPIINEKALNSWIEEIPNREKDRIIKELLSASSPHLGRELLQRFKKETSNESELADQSIRTVGELLSKAEAYEKKREKELAEKRAKEKAARKKAEAIAREKHLNGIAGSEDSIWEQVESLICSKKPKLYKQALNHLIDLRDLGKKNNTNLVFKSKLEGIREKHQRKTSFISQLNGAGLE